MPVVVGRVDYDVPANSIQCYNAAAYALAEVFDPYLLSSPVSASKTIIGTDPDTEVIRIQYAIGNANMVINSFGNAYSIGLSWNIRDSSNNVLSSLGSMSDSYLLIRNIGHIDYRIICGAGGFRVGIKKISDNVYLHSIHIQRLRNLDNDQIVAGVNITYNDPIYPSLSNITFYCCPDGVNNRNINKTTEGIGITRTDEKTALSNLYFYDSLHEKFSYEAIGLVETSPNNISAKVTASNGKSYAAMDRLWMEV